MTDFRTSTEGTLAKALAKAKAKDTVIVDSAVQGASVTKDVRLVRDGGTITGTLVNKSTARFEGLLVDKGSIDYTAVGGSEVACTVRNAPGKGRVVRKQADEVTWEDPVAEGAGDHACWILGPDKFRLKGTLTVRGGGHQNIEFFRARNFEVDAIDTAGAASLGCHFLQAGWYNDDDNEDTPMIRQKAGVVHRIGSSRNRNNGIDSNGSTGLDLGAVYSEFNGSLGAQDQEGGAEGAGLLFYDTTYSSVGLIVGRNNAQGQPNNRDAMALAASGRATMDGCHHITIGQVIGIDDQASHTQRWALGFGGRAKGGIHDVVVKQIGGGGNIRGLTGAARPENVDLARDRIVLPAGVTLTN